VIGKVLVTGGNGFFGRHLVRLLGERALCPDRSEVDLLSAGQVQAYLEAHRPESVIHAAGFVGGIGLNVLHPGRMALENLKMGMNVLEAAALAGKIHVAIISTICVYPANAPVPTGEDSIYEGFPAKDTAAYGLAKRELLSLAEALKQEFGLPYSYVIPTNLYGPGDHFEEAKSHVVPALIQRLHKAKKESLPFIEVWGDGTATRDLLYVEDAAKAVMEVLRTGPHPMPINIGSGRETSIRELVETLSALIGYRGEIRWDASRPAGASRRALDIERARACFGFHPETGLREGLGKAIAWYLSNELEGQE
jgi:GDP-L-fucose synthase